MPQVIQASNLAKQGSDHSSFTLRLYLFGVLVLVVGFSVLSIVIMVLAQYTGQPSNPFVAFNDIFPGQPASALETKNFSCSIVPYENNLDKEICRFYPTSGAISQVTVLVSKGVIRTTGFGLRDNMLSVGDLMLLWGNPLKLNNKSSIHFLSHNQGVTAVITEYSGRFSPFLKVMKVIITTSSI